MYHNMVPNVAHGTERVKTTPKIGLKRGLVSHQGGSVLSKNRRYSFSGMCKRGLFENVDPVLKEGFHCRVCVSYLPLDSQ